MRAAVIVWYRDLLTNLDRSNTVDGLMFFGTVPVVMGVWDTAMVDETDSGIYTTNFRARSAW